MKVPEVITLDYETEGIKARPNYPPRPVSVALLWPGERRARTLAWGHPTGNTCTEREALGELRKAYASRYPLLMQNAEFDLDVSETHFGLRLPNWDRWHDTKFLLALFDPHAPTFSLKPSAERLLGIKPEEQDRMYEWISANVPEAARKPSIAGAYICRCPYQIVKPYHVGDLTRTLALFRFLYPRIVDMGMLEAYRRELKLMPILLANARQGVRLDVPALERDLPAMKKGVEKADAWLRKRLGVENLDSDRQLGEALYSKNLITTWTRTAKGQLSVSKKHLTLPRFRDPRVYHALQYRTQLSTCINMFALPWLELASASRDGATLHPSWQQVRSSRNGGDASSGARSNRIICTRPNELNVTKSWKRAASAGYRHPDWLNVPPLPLMRRYRLPDKGEEWGKRDFNSQELRLFAHFEEGPVMQGFLSDPKYDIHESVRAEAERRLIEAGLRDSFDRDSAKTCVFGRLYGQGLTGLMDALYLSEEEKPVAQIIQRAINAALPSIKALDDQLKALVAEGLPIRTIGGRLYYCEPPAYSERYGRNMTFEYKMLNYLLQPSGADVTKETIVRWDAHPRRTARFLNSVYDEINFSSPRKDMKRNHEVLRECMLLEWCDVPLLSEGQRGPNWAELEAFNI